MFYSIDLQNNASWDLDPIWVYLAGNYMSYSTGTIDCSGLQTTTLYIVHDTMYNVVVCCPDVITKWL